MTKSELEEELASVKAQLAAEQSRPTGHSVSNVHLDMGEQHKHKLAIANAVAEGMKALQGLDSGDSYGMYFESEN